MARRPTAEQDNAVAEGPGLGRLQTQSEARNSGVPRPMRTGWT
ncbi:hypothetical protein T261_0509 [Streptomyces lydicus]|nr:hypothetical protein T261_0509 [Streptomyces lydicus]